MLGRAARISYAVIAGLAGAFGCSEEPKAPPKETETWLALKETVKTQDGGTVRVPFTLTNRSKNVFSYGWDPDGSGLYNLQGMLFQDGKEVRGRIRSDRPMLDKKHVKNLKQGESVSLRYMLPYTEVKPGKYDFRLKYELSPGSFLDTEFGLTPMKFEQTMILVVQD